MSDFAIIRAERRGELPGWIDPYDVPAVGIERKEVDEDQPDLNDLTVSELRAFAEDLDIEGRSSMRKAELVEAIRLA